MTADPGVGLELFGDEAEERRLARAVGGDERRALAEGEGEGDVLEESVARVPEAEIGNLKDGHREGVPSTRPAVSSATLTRFGDPP